MFNRILLVARDHGFQQFLADALNDEWFETVCADDETAALRLLNETKPELLITEIVLPEKSGFELCRYVREDLKFRSLPVVILDSHFDALNQSMAFSAGADAYLSSPFETSELIEIVGSLLEDREDVPQARPASSDLFPQTQALMADSYDYTETSLGADDDPVPSISHSTVKRITRGLQVSAPPRPSNVRYFVKWLAHVGALMALVGVAVLVGTNNPDNPTIRKQEVEAEKVESGASVLAGPQPGELSSTQEMSRIDTGRPRSKRDTTQKAVRRARHVKTNQTNQGRRSAGAIKEAKADISRQTARQNSIPVTLSKYSPGANNSELRTLSSRSPTVSSSRSDTAAGHMKRSGHETKNGARYSGSVEKHSGQNGVKKAGVWAGKSVGRGAKWVWSAFKSIF